MVIEYEVNHLLFTYPYNFIPIGIIIYLAIFCIFEEMESFHKYLILKIILRIMRLTVWAILMSITYIAMFIAMGG